MSNRCTHNVLKATAVAVVAAVAMVLGACGSGSTSTTGSARSGDRPAVTSADATPATVILAAAESSGGQATVRTTMRLSVDGEMVGELTSQGAADGSSARITTELPLIGRVPMLVTPEATYLGLPDLPNGAEWLRVNARELGLAERFGIDAPDPPDPQRAFDLLRDATDEATEVGPDTIDGIETTHYRFDADVRELLDDAMAGGAPLDGLPAPLMDADATTSTDVWIDAEGLVRRLRVELRSGGAADPAVPPSVGYEFTFAEYGEPVDVTAPDPATVLDAAELWPFND